MTLSTLQQKWIERFTLWAESRSDIRAALLVGSHGRTNNFTGDEWSDVDVMFIATRPGLYTGNSAWMRDIDLLWTGVLAPDETFGALAPVACGFSVYQDGLAVDFFILSNTRARWMTRVVRLLHRCPYLRQRLPDSVANLGTEVAELFRPGVQVLIDKDGLADQLRGVTQTIPAAPPSPPSQHAFQRDFDDFWYGAAKAAAYLRQGRLPAAMKILELGKSRVLKWVEWHARAKNGWKGNRAIYRLKWIDRWADARVVAALPGIFALYDAEDMWRALFEMMKLYRWLAAETADLLGYDYSSDADAPITAWVKQRLAEKDG